LRSPDREAEDVEEMEVRWGDRGVRYLFPDD